MSKFNYSLQRPLFDTTTPQPEQPNEPQTQAVEDDSYSRYHSPHKGNEGKTAQSGLLMLFTSPTVYTGMVIFALASARVGIPKWKKDKSNDTWNIKLFDASGGELSPTNPKIKKILAEGPDRVVALNPQNYRDLLAKFPTLVPYNIQPDKQVRVWSQFGLNKAGGGWKGRIIKIDKDVEFSEALDKLISPNKNVGQGLNKIPFGDFGESISLDRWMGEPKQRKGLSIADTSDLPPKLRNSGSIDNVEDLLNAWFGENEPGKDYPTPPNSQPTSASSAPVVEEPIATGPQRINEDIVSQGGGIKFNPVPQRTPQRFGAPANEAIQGPEMRQQPVSTDLGRDAAREILDQRIPRQQVPMPDATTSRNELQQMQARQQSLSEDAQRQLSGNRVRNQPVEAPRVSQPLAPANSPIDEVAPTRRNNVITQQSVDKPTINTKGGQVNIEFGRRARSVVKNAGVLAADVAADIAIDQIPDARIREPVRAGKDALAIYTAPIISLLGLGGDSPKDEVKLNATDTLINLSNGQVMIRSKSPTYNEDYPLDVRHWRFSTDKGVETVMSVEEANQLLKDRELNTNAVRKGSIVPRDMSTRRQMDARNRKEVEANDRRRARQRLQVSNTAPPAPTLPPVSAYERSLQTNPSAAAEAASTPARQRVNRRATEEVMRQPDNRMPNPKDPEELFTDEELAVRKKYDQLRRSGKTKEAERYGRKMHKKLHKDLYV